MPSRDAPSQRRVRNRGLEDVGSENSKSKSKRTKDRTAVKSPKPLRKSSPPPRDSAYESVGSDRSQGPSMSQESIEERPSVPELERRSTTRSSGLGGSYPSFSKAHSREAPRSQESLSTPRKSQYTPESSKLNGSKTQSDPSSSDKPATSATARPVAPPSPPLTNVEPEGNQRESSTSKSKHRRQTTPELHVRKGSIRTPSHLKDGKSRKKTTSSPERVYSDSRSAVSNGNGSGMSSQKGFRSASGSALPPRASVRSSTASDKTSIVRPGSANVARTSKPSGLSRSPQRSASNSTLRTPTQSEPGEFVVPVQVVSTNTPQPEQDPFSPADSNHSFMSPVPPPPPPIPPPPPLDQPALIPRVDYLLQNGGLDHVAPRRLLSALNFGSLGGTRAGIEPAGILATPSEPKQLFAPLHDVLEDYLKVFTKQGSIAVATGYRSVARRLLDRLEAVFARDISSENCDCAICKNKPATETDLDESTGVSWGVILEYVSGRQELPQWPPFSMNAQDTRFENDGFERDAPMQKLDIDVPDEYREHYIRQSKKTKQAVKHWLASQPEMASSPPQDVDDETLTFAILTHLEPHERRIFTALMKGMSNIPDSRAPTPAIAHDPSASPTINPFAKTRAALQRLYRLSNSPRDPECALYLLRNPKLHNVLATIAAISAGEWDILTSGRFDGFLWSGAEDAIPTASPSVNPSTIFEPQRPQTTPPQRSDFTPGQPFRTPSAMSFAKGPHSQGQSPSMASLASLNATRSPAPVQLDEETEIAILAEVEREIYQGMEALEDAFETLHCQAEAVRRSLRERSAGLALAAQTRKGGLGDVEVRLGTPASATGWGAANGAFVGWDSETDDGFDDLRSELAPDDSASNISRTRRRRPHRRSERRTPAPVEEEDEERSDVTPSLKQRRR